ncbi:MAG: glycosyltransferase [Planctomycetota bacterium]
MLAMTSSQSKAKERERRVVGILNGCEYPEGRQPPKMEYHRLLDLLKSSILKWAGTEKGSLSPSHFVAYSRLCELSLACESPRIVLTSVTRTTLQKVFLMKAPGTRFSSGLEGILQHLGDRGVCLILGTGEAEYEQFLTDTSGSHSNLVFLNGFSPQCADALYANGDLFLMPSSYEPCGISQMHAMRDGQPCVVHGVGGLRDTVEDGSSGFSFGGESVEEQVDNFVDTTIRAIQTRLEDQERWRQISENAARARFLWTDSVKKYINLLYQR